MRPPFASEILHTERLTGTRLSLEEDLDDLAALYADPRVMATLSSDGRPWARARVAELLARHDEHWSVRGYGMWVFRDAERRFVARAGLRWRELDSAGGAAELYYAVVATRWGEGFATEAAGRIVRVAFDDLSLDPVIAFCLPTNRASRRVLEKCGFEVAGEVEHAGLPHLLLRLEAPPPA